MSRRLFLAARRTTTYLGIILRSKLDGVVIFTSWGYSFLEKGMMVFAARLFGKRVILNPRSGLILDDLEKSRFMRWFIPSVFRQCNIVMCQSQSWKQFYQSISGLPDNRFIVIPNWVDFEPYLQISAQRKRADTRISILFLGRIERNKGVYALAEAVQMFHEDLPHCRFIICGMGSELEAFKEKIADLALSHLFEFRGWVTGAEKIKALQDADIFVLPSYREGLPNSLLEAMASGLAVVATAVGGIPDILDDNAGRLIQPGDVEALGHAIVELSKSAELRGHLGQSARSYVLENHDINKIWPEFLNMLQMNNKK
jgi:glycosyltransferase involved in cell wall biosynthesis